jgi:hypothetical protein
VKNVLLVGLSTLAIFLSACSNSDTDKKNSPLEDKGGLDYDTKSCQFSASEGERAYENLLNTESIVTTSFGKEFNENYFTAIAKASIENSILFIRQTDVELYRASAVPTKACTRSLFANLNPLPADIQGHWNSLGGSDPTIIILGLYLGEAQEHLRSTETKAAIIVRENTNRWTLVHEFMHHLFQLRMTEKGIDVEKVKDEFVSIASQWTDFNEYRTYTAEEMRSKVKAWNQLIDKGVLVYSSYTLEEMTIEKYMKEKFATGQLSYVPADSNYYIYASGKKAASIFSKMKSEATALQRKARKMMLEEEVGELQQRINLLSSREQEVANIMAAYPDTKETGGHSLNGLVGMDDHSRPVDCPHEKVGNEIYNIIMHLN